MRFALLATFAVLLAAPVASATCADIEGVCVFDEERGDPECEAEESVGDRGTALYVDRAGVHLGVSGHEACGRGSSKDPDDRSTTYEERSIHLFATAAGGGLGLIWSEQRESSDGVERSGCWLGLQAYDGTPDAPSAWAACPAPPPDAGWGRLLP